MLLFNKHFRRRKLAFLTPEETTYLLDPKWLLPSLFHLWKRETKAILIRIISEKNEQGDRLDPSRCEFFSPKKLDETVSKSPVSEHRRIPLRYWDVSRSIFQYTRNPLKKEEMEKRYCQELTQTTIVSAVLVTLSLSTFLLNSLVGQSLRVPQIIS